MGRLFNKKPQQEAIPDKMRQVFDRLLALLDNDEKQNALMPKFLQELMAKGNLIDESFANDINFGRFKNKPIPVNGPLGEMTYLSKLIVKETGGREQGLFS